MLVIALVLLDEKIFNVASLRDLEHAREVYVSVTYGSHALLLCDNGKIL